MSEKQHICIYCDTWESGGIESFLHNVLCHMELDSLDIDIVASCLRPSIFTAPLKQRGIRFIELSGSTRKVARNYRLFSALLQKEHYDVVHLNVFQGLSLAYLLPAKRAGVPVRIAHSHNTALRKSKTRQLKLLIHRLASRLFSRYATELWACSSNAAVFMFPQRLLTGQGWRFIPNGIDLKRFRFDPQQREEMRRALGVTDRFVVGNVGRLCEQKNQDFLLDVFAALIKRRPDSRLLLVGEGEAREYLEQKAAALGIADAVIFYGVTDRVERLYWAMDVFAFPSRFEGLGIAVVEAQAAGLPVICSENVPVEALLTASTSQLEVNSVTAWMEELLSCSTSAVREMNEDACKSFGVEHTSEKIEQAYKGRGMIYIDE